MTIWSFRTLGLFAGLLLTLTACEEGAESAFTTSRSGADLFGPRNHALPTAALMQGDLRIDPPDGYCFDRRSLRDNFVILARCDLLGSPESSGGAPVGLMTVTVVPTEGDPSPTELAQMVAPEGAEVLARRGGLVPSVLVEGSTVPGTVTRHWRAMTRRGPYLVGLRAYGPPGSGLVDAMGADLLRDLAEGITRAMPGPAA